MNVKVGEIDVIFLILCTIKYNALLHKPMATEDKSDDKSSSSTAMSTMIAPVVIAVISGLVTLVVGLITNHWDNQAKIKLEDKKFQLSILLRATDSKNYEEFSTLLDAFQKSGYLDLDSQAMQAFKLSQLSIRETEKHIKQLDTASKGSAVKKLDDRKNGWFVVTGGSKDYNQAKSKKDKANSAGFQNVRIFHRNGVYRVCLGEHALYSNAIDALYTVKERLNPTAYLVNMNEWCSDSKLERQNQDTVYQCTE